MLNRPRPVDRSATGTIGPALALVAAIALSGLPCAAQVDDAQAQRERADRSVIEARELAEAIARAGDNMVILDVRTEEEYATGHLPGAVRVSYPDWSDLSLSEDTGLSHEAAWHERLGALGIDADDAVLVYDNGRMTQAARVWFIAQHFGVARVAVVNGGLPAIAEAADAGAVSLVTEPSEPEPVEFAPSAAAAGRIGNIDRHQLKAAIERGGVQVLDARTAEEYAGRDSRGNARAGHLPGAINVPHTGLLDSRGRLRPADELRGILERAGFVQGQPVIAHCQGGGRAALAALAAARAGYGPVLNYYLSFGDWANDATCPIVAPE